jgi:hypothetical protein
MYGGRVLNRLHHCAAVPPNKARIGARHPDSGIQDSVYNSEPEMERGTWFRTDPDVWTAGNPAILAIEVRDDRVCAKWQSALDPAEWQIPSRYIHDLPIEVI